VVVSCPVVDLLLEKNQQQRRRHLHVRGHVTWPAVAATRSDTEQLKAAWRSNEIVSKSPVSISIQLYSCMFSILLKFSNSFKTFNRLLRLCKMAELIVSVEFYTFWNFKWNTFYFLCLTKRYAMKALWGNVGKDLSFLYLDASWKTMISFSPRSLKPLERAPDSCWIRGWVGFQSRINLENALFYSVHTF
jgi:hypothetical protein